MIDSLNQYLGIENSYRQLIPSAQASYSSMGSVEAKTEFLVIFYKELLKQVFKAPDLNLGEEENQEKSFISNYNSDLMVEELARQLAKSGKFDPKWMSVYGAGR